MMYEPSFRILRWTLVIVALILVLGSAWRILPSLLRFVIFY